jgi:hypothetical protein
MCRECRRDYGRQHYAANRERYIANAAALKRRTRLKRVEFLLEYFCAHPCADCGETDPVVLEFDHIGEKTFDVMQKFAERRWQAILDEIEKCEVVCANCHRRRTARRRGALRHVLTQSSHQS